MRTTVDIDVEELDELVRITGARSRSEVLTAGMKAIRERAASNRLADLLESGLRSPEAAVAPRRRF